MLTDKELAVLTEDEMEQYRYAMRSDVVILVALEKYARAECARRELEESRRWVPVTEGFPQKPVPPSDDHAPCLCYYPRSGEILLLQWNTYHLCWDGADGDDYFCDPQDVSHYMPLPSPPDAKEESNA